MSAGARDPGCAVLVLLAGLLPATARAACGDDLPAAARLTAEAADRSVPAALQLAFAPRPAPIQVGRHFALDIRLCAAAGQALPATLVVDAEMPAHRHGMNYRATVAAQGGGRFAAEGLMFHMPGRWRLVFELPAGAGGPPQRLVRDIDLR